MNTDVVWHMTWCRLGHRSLLFANQRGAIWQKSSSRNSVTCEYAEWISANYFKPRPPQSRLLKITQPTNKRVRKDREAVSRHSVDQEFLNFVVKLWAVLTDQEFRLFDEFFWATETAKLGDIFTKLNEVNMSPARNNVPILVQQIKFCYTKTILDIVRGVRCKEPTCAPRIFLLCKWQRYLQRPLLLIGVLVKPINEQGTSWQPNRRFRTKMTFK
jgi:hypothetical protein